MGRVLNLSPRLSTLLFLWFLISAPTLAKSVDSSELSSKSRSLVTSYRAKVNGAGNQIAFSTIAVKAAREAGLSPRLRLTFRSGTVFSPESVRLALNGLKACYRPGHLPSAGQWESSDDGPVLVLGLGDFDFDKLDFYSRVDWIQSHHGQLRFWVSAPSRVRTATLELVRISAQAALPVVVLESVDPSGWLKTSSTVRFAFRASAAPASGFECAIDNEAFAACRSPYLRTSLTNGIHYFRARALAVNGNPGPSRKLDFYIWAKPPGIVIDDVNPEESPTLERGMQIAFRKVGSLAAWAQAQCSLDNAPFKNCASPVRYNDLADGAHSVAIRRVDPYLFGITLYAQPAVYRWSIENKTPSLSWTQTPPALTSSATATFAFQADMDARFVCSLDGASPSACTSPVELRDLADGEHDFAVSVDGANAARAVALSHRWMVDQTAPVLQFTSIVPQQDPSAIDSLSASYSSTEPLVSTRCSLDGNALGSCASPIRLRALAEGRHVMSLDGTDAAGNRSASIQHAWYVDKTLPSVSIQLLFPTALPTRETTASFRLMPSEASTFSCSLDSAAAYECGAEVTLNNLDEGFHRLTVTATDAAGNTGEAAWFEWQIDRTRPLMTLGPVQPPENPTSSTSRSIAFSADEAMTRFSCELDAAGLANCSSPFLANGLADGAHRFVVRGTDLAGNVSLPLIVDWTVSTVAYVTLGAVEPQTSPASSRVARFEFSSVQSSDFICSLDNATVSACFSPATYGGLTDGEHTFSVQARNALGAAGPAVTYRWNVDATLPVVALSTATPAWSPTASQSFVQAFSANEPATFSCRLDAGGESACVSPIRFDSLSNGDHTLSIAATDAAGNRSLVVTYAWRVDTTPIVVSNFALSRVMRNSAVITWTTDRPTNGRVEYAQGSELPSNPLSTSPSTALGTTHTVTLNGLAANTLYTVRSVAVDLDGRTSASQPPQTFRTNR